MNLVFFGLSISSAWGNGHATLLRGLFRALHNKGHEIHFFEKDVPYYAAHRDACSFPFAHLHLYSDWDQTRHEAQSLLADADVGIVTSYCSDGPAACDLVLNSKLWRGVFYDMDTPVTLLRLKQGETVPYLPACGLGPFNLVLSYTGGEALVQLQERLGARSVAPLYGWVDPEIYFPVSPKSEYAADLSYLGTYSADRQDALERLLIDPARDLASKRFVIGGAMHPNLTSWPRNIRHFEHVAPPDHAAFYSSSLLTLNVTRGSMATMGYCPSGRLFEAAACGTAVMSDWWPGLDTFFEPDEEILIASDTTRALEILQRDKGKLQNIGSRARERTLSSHTADLRAEQLINLLQSSSDIRPAEKKSTWVLEEV